MAHQSREKGAKSAVKASGKAPDKPLSKTSGKTPAPPGKDGGARRGQAGTDNQSTAKAGPGLARAKVPFPRKNQAPTETEFLARLPLPTGKKFDGVRTFLKKQKGVVEDLYFYGPKTGWAYRYLRGSHSLATIMIHDDHLMGIVSLDAAALAVADFDGLSDVGQRSRKMAHGSPSMLWLDLPLDGSGAADFKALLKAKLKGLPPPSPPPLPPPPRT